MIRTLALTQTALSLTGTSNLMPEAAEKLSVMYDNELLVP
jgi:hypothetical protein